MSAYGPRRNDRQGCWRAERPTTWAKAFPATELVARVETAELRIENDPGLLSWRCPSTRVNDFRLGHVRNRPMVPRGRRCRSLPESKRAGCRVPRSEHGEHHAGREERGRRVPHGDRKGRAGKEQANTRRPAPSGGTVQRAVSAQRFRPRIRTAMRKGSTRTDAQPRPMAPCSGSENTPLRGKASPGGGNARLGRGAGSWVGRGVARPIRKRRTVEAVPRARSAHVAARIRAVDGRPDRPLGVAVRDLRLYW